MTDTTDTIPRFDRKIVRKVAPFPRKQFLEFVKRVRIQTKDYGVVGWQLLGSQVYLLDEICRGMEEGITTFIVLKNRQCGSTTFFVGLDFFWAMKHGGLLGTFVLHKEEARDDWRVQIDMFYNDMPHKVELDGEVVRFKRKMVQHNRNVVTFDNGSRFRYLIAGTAENRKGGMGRSGASNYTHMTEVAFYGNEDDINAFRASESSLYAHRMHIEETTANGYNHFADKWDEAKKSKTVRAIFLGWWRDERNQFSADDSFYQIFMEDTRLSKLERDRCRAVKDEYGVHISLQQLAWYRWKLEEEFHGDQSLMDQEFPFTDEDAFQATGAKYFTSQSLSAAIKESRKKYPFQTFAYRTTQRWEETQIVQYQDPRAQLRIWEKASPFGHYAIACDPAYGSSDDADRNVICVLRCYADGCDQVAEFCSNALNNYKTAWALAHLAGYYGGPPGAASSARVMIEMQGPGKAVFEEFRKIQLDVRLLPNKPETHELRNWLGNVSHFFYKRIDNPGGTEFAFHWITSGDLKRYVMARFKDAFELDRLRIRSIPLLDEMRSIVNDEGNICAEGAKKDDRVIAAAFAYECHTRWVAQRVTAAGMTRARSQVVDKNGGESHIDRMFMNFMRNNKIKVPTS